MIKFILILLFVIVNIEAYSIKDTLAKLETLKHLKDIKFKEVNVDYNPFFSPSVVKAGSKSSQISSVKLTKRKLVFEISAIFNKEVFIDGRWYKENDKIDGYKILHIYAHGVTLKKGRKLLHLSIDKKVNILKITEKIK